MTDELRAAIESERSHLRNHVLALRRNFDAIVEGAELTSTDDEHDPEGTTIAYERAQVAALLQQAQRDLDALDEALVRLDDGSIFVCANCGDTIPVERLLALPTTRRCVRCAG
jgi:RNA polymerase-binding transcription factor DksA